MNGAFVIQTTSVAAIFHANANDWIVLRRVLANCSGWRLWWRTSCLNAKWWWRHAPWLKAAATLPRTGGGVLKLHVHRCCFISMQQKELLSCSEPATIVLRTKKVRAYKYRVAAHHNHVSWVKRRDTSPLLLRERTRHQDKCQSGVRVLGWCCS